jgi:hypothetical protein
MAVHQLVPHFRLGEPTRRRRCSSGAAPAPGPLVRPVRSEPGAGSRGAGAAAPGPAVQPGDWCSFTTRRGSSLPARLLHTPGRRGVVFHGLPSVRLIPRHARRNAPCSAGEGPALRDGRSRLAGHSGSPRIRVLRACPAPGPTEEVAHRPPSSSRAERVRGRQGGARAPGSPRLGGADPGERGSGHARGPSRGPARAPPRGAPHPSRCPAGGGRARSTRLSAGSSPRPRARRE